MATPTRFLRRTKSPYHPRRTVSKPSPVVAAGGGWGGAGATATLATAGVPGTLAPAGADLPADLSALTPTVTASPGTLWTVGQNIVLADANTAHWNGTIWVTGNAPA